MPALGRSGGLRLDLDAAQILHVGDDPWLDVQGAHGAGFRSAWINRTGAVWPAEITPPHLTITTLQQLAERYYREKLLERNSQTLDLFVAPQRWEGFGLTPLEAMATAVPVVATDVGAFSELIVEGETGAVIPANDLPKMLSATSTLLEDPDTIHHWGDIAQRHVTRRFALEGEATSLGTLYVRVDPSGP